MLVAEKTLHIELDIRGSEENIQKVLNCLQASFSFVPVENSQSDEDEFEDITKTDWYKQMDENRYGNILAGMRYKIEMTQRELAEKAGFATSTISEYESGRRKISKKAAYKLAKPLNCSPDKFYKS